MLFLMQPFQTNQKLNKTKRNMDSDSAFHLHIVGQIEAARFVLGAPSRQLFARFDFVAGADWQLVSGVATGVTQCAAGRDDPSCGEEVVVFNMPVELMYKATNAHGWPQLIVSLYGRNWWGTESTQGYARMHVPLGATPAVLRAPILNARCTNVWAGLLGWASDRRPELKDPCVLADGTRMRGLVVESYGEMTVRLQTMQRGTERLSLDYGQRQHCGGDGR